MTKTYAILLKKLQELELQLSHSHTNFSQEIHQKLLFIANLLSAEIASCPTKPRHLKHIARRLAHLEAAFHDSGTEHLLHDHNGHVDDSSACCSCTESCLNDDGEVASSCLDDDEECGEFYECVDDQEYNNEKEEIIIKEEISIVGVGKLCGAMATGFLIAVFFIQFFGNYLDQLQQNGGGFVTPT